MGTCRARFVHKISPSDADVSEPFEMPDGAFSDRNTLGKALRKAGVLHKGMSLRNFRAEGEEVIAFPRQYWHSVIITPA